ncbi:MAG: tetratricopeptide repeat protein [Chloroflexi bacterium]|nr:tetratricopeptide repeat protein [Chloroflexota bacterium]
MTSQNPTPGTNPQTPRGSIHELTLPRRMFLVFALGWLVALAFNVALFPPWPGAWLYLAAGFGEGLLALLLGWRARSLRAARFLTGLLITAAALLAWGAAALVPEWPTGKLPAAEQAVRLVQAMLAWVPPLPLPRVIHPNTLALLLVPVLPLQFGLAVDGLRALVRRERPSAPGLVLLAWVTLPQALGLLWASQSRAGVLALAAAGALMLGWLLPAPVRWGVGLAALALVGITWSYWRAWWLAISPRLSTLTVARMGLWRYAAYIAWGFPLTGIGFRSLRFWYPRLFPPEFYEALRADFRANAHNAYMQLAADMGLPGLVGYLAFLLWVWGMWNRVWARRQALAIRGVGPGWLLGLGGSWVALAVFGLGESNGPGFFFTGWLLAAVVLILREHLPNEAEVTQPWGKRLWQSPWIRWAVTLLGIAVLVAGVAWAWPWNRWSLAYRAALLEGQPAAVADPPAGHVPGWLWRLNLYLIDQGPPPSEVGLQTLMQAAPRHPDVAHVLGWYYDRIGRVGQAAYLWRLGEQRSALSRASSRARKQGDAFAARWYAWQAYRLDPERGALTWAQYLRWAKEDDTALQVLLEAVARYPDSSEVGRWWFEIGHIYRAHKDCRAAAHAYGQAIAAAPDDAWPWWRKDAAVARGQCLYELGERDAAIAQMQALIEAQPDDGRGYWGMAWIAMKDGAYDEADAWFRKALAREPQNRWWWLTWANMWRDAEPQTSAQLARALSLYEKTAQRFPTWPHVYYNWAKALLWADRPWDAAQTYQRGLELDPEAPFWRWRELGIYWEKAGNPERALAAYCQALALHPNDPQSQQRIEVLGGSCP